MNGEGMGVVLDIRCSVKDITLDEFIWRDKSVTM